MAQDQTTQALCHKCQSAMVYVTAMPHPTFPSVIIIDWLIAQRGNFVAVPVKHLGFISFLAHSTSGSICNRGDFLIRVVGLGGVWQTRVSQQQVPSKSKSFFRAEVQNFAS